MEYKINKYPDGSTYVELSGRHEPYPNFTFRVNDYKDYWILSQLVEVCNYHGLHPIITIPNLLDAQADRRFGDMQSSGLKLVVKFLNSLDATFKIFHPHNSEAVENSISNVNIIDNYEFIKTILDRSSNLDNLILMASDAGGFKPLAKLCEKLNWKGEMYSASKARSWDAEEGTKFIQQIDRQDFGGKDILIIDDLSIYGGTFKGLSKLLKERNCGDLYLAVSHMAMQNLGKDPVTNYFKKVFTTNSKFERYYGKYAEGSDRTVMPKNLEIIKQF